MDCYCSDHTLLWDSHCPSYLLLVEVLLDFCSLKATGISISQVNGISWGYSILVWCLFFSADSKEIFFFLGRQNPALTHLQSLGIEWYIRKTGMAHIKWVYSPAGFQYLQLFPFGVYIEKKTQADNSSCFKTLHGDCSVTELFIFRISTCGFPISVVGLRRAGGKVPQRSGGSVGSSSQLAPEWDGETTEQMGWLSCCWPFLLRCLLKMRGRKLLCKKNDC